MKKTCDNALPKPSFLPSNDPQRLQQLQLQKDFESIMINQRNQFLFRDPMQEYLSAMPPSLMNMQPWNQMPQFNQNTNRQNRVLNPFSGINPLEVDPFMNSSLQLYLQLAECQNLFALNNQFKKASQECKPQELKKSQIPLDDKSNDCAKTETTVEDTKAEDIQQIKSNVTDKPKMLVLDQKDSEPVSQVNQKDKVLNPKELEFGTDNSFNSWDMDEQGGETNNESFLEESANDINQKADVRASRSRRNMKGTNQKPPISSNIEPARKKRVKKY